MTYRERDTELSASEIEAVMRRFDKLHRLDKSSAVTWDECRDMIETTLRDVELEFEEAEV